MMERATLVFKLKESNKNKSFHLRISVSCDSHGIRAS